jgi:thiosulfate reductase cytochrome b subunit
LIRDVIFVNPIGMVVEPIAPAAMHADDARAHDLSKDWTSEGRIALKQKVLSELPAWYSPLLHFAFPAIFGVGVVVASCLAVHGVTALQLLTIPLTFLMSNAVEWRAHKHALHKRHPIMPVLFERHTPMHHRLFVEGAMAINDWRELSMVLLPSFGVLAILSLQLPLVGLGFLFGLRNVALLFMATSMGYVLLYEWLHLAYHLPDESFIGRRALIRRLRQHHARHHNPKLMQRWNMNVTLPLFDWVFGTIHRHPSAIGSASTLPADRQPAAVARPHAD